MSQTPDPSFVLRTYDANPVTYLQSCRDDNLLFSGHQNGKILIWDIKARRIKETLHDKNENAILSLAVTKNGDLLTQSRVGVVFLWQFRCLEILDSFTCPSLGFCKSSIFELGGKEVIALATENQSEVRLISLADKTTVGNLKPSSGSQLFGMCMSIKAIMVNGKVVILVAYEDGSMILWDLRTWKELSQLKCHKDAIMDFDYHCDINKGVSGSASDSLVQWTIVNSGGTLVDLGETVLTNPGINCVNFRKDGKIFVTGGWDSQARVFGCKKMKQLAVLNYHSASIQCTHFLPDNTLILGSKDGNISFWNLYK